MKAWAQLMLGGTILLLLAGCEEIKYELRLSPAGQSLERQLTVWIEDQEDQGTTIKKMPPEALGKISQAYAVPPVNVGEKTVFKGAFNEQTPDDIGGAGRWLRETTVMGTVSSYVERFGSSDDTAARQDEKLRQLDRFVEMTMAWLSSACGADQRFGQAKERLERELRTDARNLLLMLWTANVIKQHHEGLPPEVTDFSTSPEERELARALLFLAERGYVKPREVFTAGWHEEDGQARLIQRILARKLGYGDDSPPPLSLAFLGSAKAAEESLDRFCTTTPEYQELLRQWQEECQHNPEADKPDPHEAYTELLLALFDDGSSGHPPASVKVHLAMPISPLHGNGQWDPATGEMTWACRRLHAILPWLCYAVWAEPDAAFQKARFGKVVLAGNRLVQYVEWRCGATAEEGGKWDAFLKHLTPDDDWMARLAEFSPPPSDSQDKTAADPFATPRQLLRQALAPDQDTATP